MQSQSKWNAEATLEWISGTISSSGPVTLARFMEWALYHPDFGYYTWGPDIGPRGDFTTSPEASPAFGRLLARHVADIDRLLGRPDPFQLIECGPGRGTLANDLLATLQGRTPDIYARLKYTLVEISPVLTSIQKELLSPLHSRVTQWASNIDELPGGLSGAVLANEVVDAFPVHIVEKHRQDIVEQYVDVAAGGDLCLVYGPPSRVELPAFLERYGIDLRAGQKIEINLAAEAWVGELAQLLERGIATIIDYGDTSPGRYSPARREGTLLAYRGGAVTDNVLALPGEQDLTALVDFTALQDAATSAGFQVAGLTRQANFLLGLGLGTTETVEAAGDNLEAILDYRLGLQTLISMEGLGKFHVLLLANGVDLALARDLPALRYSSIA